MAAAEARAHPAEERHALSAHQCCHALLPVSYKNPCKRFTYVTLAAKLARQQTNCPRDLLLDKAAAVTHTHTHTSLSGQFPSCPHAHNYAVLKQSSAGKEQPSLCLGQAVCAAQVAQLADEAAEAVHLLDGPDEEKVGARLHLVLDALDKVVAKAEGLLRAGQGPLALEALVAVAGEVVRPDEIPGTPQESPFGL